MEGLHTGARRWSAWGWCLSVLLLAGCQLDSREDPGFELEEPPSCGNGTAEETEVCDGDDLAGESCADFGYEEGGTLRCNDACAGYLVSECEGIPAWTPGGVEQTDPCRACGADETCVDGHCIPRTCGDGSTAAEIDGNYEIPVFEVTGRLSVPQDSPASEIERATLYFRDTRTGQVFLVSSSGEDNRSFQKKLFPGTYRVWVKITGDGWPELPVKRRVVTVEEDKSLAVDVPRPVAVRGSVNVEGPEASTPGVFEITPAAPEYDRLSRYVRPNREFDHHASDWSEDYEVRLYANQPYSVRFRPHYDEFWEVTDYLGTPDFVLAERFRPTSETRRDFSVPLPELPLRVTVDGAAASSRHRVELELFTASRVGETPAGEPVTSIRSGPDGIDHDSFGDGEVRLPLPPGEYRAEVRIRPHDARDFTQTASRTLEHPEGDGLSVDFPVDRNWVQVTGVVSGIPRDDQGRPVRESLFFRRPNGDLTKFADLLAEAPAPFDVQIPAGPHDIYADWKYVRDGEREGRQLLRSGMTFRDDKEPYWLVLQADPVVPAAPIERVELHGRVTVNGRPLTEILDPRPRRDGELTRGSIHFECLEGRCAYPEVEHRPEHVEFSEGRYRARLVPSRYRVIYRSPTSSQDWCNPPQADVIAGQSYVLDPELRVEHSHRRDFDAKALRLRGRMTVDGEAPPKTEVRKGRDSKRVRYRRIHMLRYRRDLDVDKEKIAGCPDWGNAQPVPLMRTEGAGRFRVMAFPDRYRVRMRLKHGRGKWEGSVRLGDADAELEHDFRTTRVAGRIAHPGESDDAPDPQFGPVHVRTRTGSATLVPGDDGTFSGVIIGREPTLVYERMIDTWGETSAAQGEVVLRNGCVPPEKVD